MLTFSTINELDVGSLTVGGSFIYCNGLRLQAGTPANSTLMVSDSGAFAGQSSFTIASGVLNSQVIASGSLLYQLLASTGQQLTVFVNGVSGNVAVTGQTLFNYVNTESGIIVNQLISFVLGASGALSGYIAQTGQTLYLDITGLSGVFNTTLSTFNGSWSGAVAATGQSVYADVTGLSGLFTTTITNFSGFNNTLTQNTGQQAWNAANNNGINLSGQLQIATGSAYGATANTGQALYRDITGLSGTHNLVIANTGQQAWTAANSNGINLSGMMAASGAIIDAQILFLSGLLTTDYTTYWTGRNFNIAVPNFDYTWSGLGFAGNGTGILPNLATSSGFVFHVKNKSLTLALVISGNIDNSQNFTMYPLSNYGFWSDGQTYNIE